MMSLRLGMMDALDRLPSDRGASTRLEASHIDGNDVRHRKEGRETGLNLAAKSCSFDLLCPNYSHQNGSIPEPETD